jgi:hypothetical protein
MKQEKIAKILKDRIDIDGIVKDLLAGGFSIPANKKIITMCSFILELVNG